MQLDLATLARRAGKYRRPTYTARAIETTAAQQAALQRVYMQVVRGWQTQWRENIRPLYESTLAESAFRDSVDDVQGAADEAEAALNRLVVSLGADLSGWVVEVEKWHRGKFGQLFTPVGVRLDMFLSPGDVGPTLQTVLADNASLIRSLNDQMRNGVSGSVFRGLTNRTPARDVAREIQRTAEIGRRRAELIASDQLQKLTGRLDQARQEQMGLDSFEWAHSGKQHPREEHKARDGKVYKWDSPVGKTDPPGFAIRCGCRSRAVLVISDEGAPELPAPPPPPPPPAPPPPAPPPPAPRRGFKPVVNPDVNDETIAVGSRLALQKKMSAEMAEAASDPRWGPNDNWRGHSAKDYGKAQFSPAWSDEAVSAIAAFKPELDALADQIGIPRIRGFKTITAGRANANMGGGVMGLNPSEFNARAARIGGGSADELAAAVQAEGDALRAEIQSLRDQMLPLWEQRNALPMGSPEYAALSQRIAALSKAGDRARAKLRKIGETQARTLRQANSTMASRWKPGDDVAKRPWSVAEYQKGSDRIRSTLFHEFAHHVHQYFGREGTRVIYGNPPLERRLRDMWQVAKRQGPNEGAWAAQKARKDMQPSTYATANEFEWFAENFSAFVMGRTDLVDPGLLELIESIFDGTF